MEPRHIRVIFSKTGNIRFISHLDMTRAFLRAFTRAGIKLKMSEGFSPHAKISFPLPLSVGMESKNEILDLVLSEDETVSEEKLVEELNKYFPAGLSILSARPCTRKSSEVTYCEYDIELIDGKITEEMIKMFDGSVMIKKRTKKGDFREMNISEGINDIKLNSDGTVINAICAASGSEYLNPEFIYAALKEKYPEIPDYYKIVRIRALDKDKKTFN